MYHNKEIKFGFLLSIYTCPEKLQHLVSCPANFRTPTSVYCRNNVICNGRAGMTVWDEGSERGVEGSSVITRGERLEGFYVITTLSIILSTTLFYPISLLCKLLLGNFCFHPQVVTNLISDLIPTKRESPFTLRPLFHHLHSRFHSLHSHFHHLCPLFHHPHLLFPILQLFSVHSPF